MGASSTAARSACERLDYVFTLFPRLKERRTQLAGTMSGGRAADVRHRPHLDEWAEARPARRAVHGLAPVIVAQVFDLVKRIRAEGYTVLIVEQNVSQVLKVVDRAYLLEVGRIKASGPPPSSPPPTTSAKRTWGCSEIE